MIVFHVEQSSAAWTPAAPWLDAALGEAVDAATAEAGLATTPPAPWQNEDYELSVALANDERVRELNRQWRARDKATNVLSFPSQQIAVGERPPTPMLGDIVFAYETCAREAEAQSKSFRAHFTHLAVHGLLHLYGHDHEADDEAETMEDLERRILARLGIADPYEDAEADRG